MPLSKETTDQIRKEAEEYSKKYFYSPSERLAGYQRGATAWAVWKEKAEVAKAALEEICESIDTNRYVSLNGIRGIATKAIEQWK